MSILGQIREWVQAELAPIVERVEKLEELMGDQKRAGDPAESVAAVPSTTAKASPARGRGSAGRAKAETSQQGDSSGT